MPVASVETLVPMVIRFGKPDASATIEGAQLVGGDDGGMALRFDVTREGARSLFGKLLVVHTDPRGEETRLHFAKGVAVYAPNPRRSFALQVGNKGVDVTQGRITIDYTETEDGGGDCHAQAALAPRVMSRR